MGARTTQKQGIIHGRTTDVRTQVRRRRRDHRKPLSPHATPPPLTDMSGLGTPAAAVPRIKTKTNDKTFMAVILFLSASGDYIVYGVTTKRGATRRGCFALPSIAYS